MMEGIDLQVIIDNKVVANRYDKSEKLYSLAEVRDMMTEAILHAFIQAAGRATIVAKVGPSRPGEFVVEVDRKSILKLKKLIK